MICRRFERALRGIQRFVGRFLYRSFVGAAGGAHPPPLSMPTAREIDTNTALRFSSSFDKEELRVA